MRGQPVQEFYRLPPEEQAAFAADTMRRYGGDVFAAGYNGTLAVLALGGKVKFRERGAPDVTDPLITDILEIDHLDISRIKQDYYYQSAFNVSKNLVALAGEEYPVSAGSWGPFTLAGMLVGTESLMRKCMKDKEAVRTLLDFSLEIIKVYSEDIFDLGIDIGTIAEPTASADMISRKIFEEFALPWLKKTFDWYAEKGLVSSLHICGNITDRLAGIEHSGARILSLDYKVSMKTAAEVLGGKLILAGNADPVEILMNGSAETVRDAYLKIFQEVAGFPYILMPGCTLPSKTPLENVMVLRELAYNTKPFWR
jgi:uroporphyrinogen decarboxylase